MLGVDGSVQVGHWGNAALSRDGVPGMIIVFRELPPAEGSVADFSPPEGMVLPPGMLGRQKN